MHPTTDSIGGLRRFNLVMGMVHAVSATVMLVLANDFSIDVTTAYLRDQPGQGLDPSRFNSAFGFPIAAGTVGFLYLSAFFHLLIASPVGWARYRRGLEQGINRFRWVEYSMSATLMIVVIALLPGIQDVAALIAIAGANVAMILFGWVMEVANPPDRQTTWWTSFVMGSVVGAVPWIAIALYIAGGGGRTCRRSSTRSSCRSSPCSTASPSINGCSIGVSGRGGTISLVSGPTSG